MATSITGFCFLIGAGVDALQQGTTTVYSKERGWLARGTRPGAALGFRVSF
jgi:hypothetical protein